MHRLLASSAFESEAARLTAELCGLRGWVIQQASYPNLIVDFTRSTSSTLRIVLDCTDFPAQPPAITLADKSGTPLVQAPVAPGGQFHQGPHAITGRPFVCMRGSREYHTHESHLGDLWDNYRETPEFTLGGILTQVWNAWLKVPS